MDASPNFCLQHLAMQNAAVHLAGMTVIIDGLQYEGAHTNGDGACGLHAPFGECVNGELYGNDIRGRV